jgi:hypothetical protein
MITQKHITAKDARNHLEDRKKSQCAIGETGHVSLTTDDGKHEQLTIGSFGITTPKVARKLMRKYVKS